MRAVTARRYGGVEVLAVEEVPAPIATPGTVVVDVHASSLNAADWHLLQGVPYGVRLVFGLRRPRRPVIGRDYAGVVVSVGEGVEHVRPGDRVFGEAAQTLAGRVRVKAGQATLLPDAVSMRAAGATPLAGGTAFQAVRAGGVRAGQRVLVVGASGGVGSFAVQLAAHAGAQVTGVCGPGNVDLVRGLGAHDVVDYTAVDPTATGEAYDVVLDIAGGRRPVEYVPVLADDGVLVSVGAPPAETAVQRLVQPIPAMAAVAWTSRRYAPRMLSLTARSNVGLPELAALIASGEVRPAVERVVDLDGVASAMAVVGAQRSRGKTAVAVVDTVE